MYEPSRLITSFYVKGFQYWEGATVLGDMHAGDGLELAAEPDNPHDASAVALRFRGSKLGYVPAEDNALLALMLHFGHGGAFEAVVQQVDAEAAPWKQVRVGVFVRDAR